jgi:hypothetical protein
MSLEIENKKFKEQFSLVKETFNTIQVNIKNLAIFSLFILILFTIFDYLNLSTLSIQTQINPEEPYSANTLSIMGLEIFKTFLFLYILSVMSQSYIFMEEKINIKKIFLSFISAKLYLNLIFFGFFMLFCALLFGHLGFPEGLIEQLIANQDNEEKFNLILSQYSDTMNSMDVFWLIFSVSGFIFTFSFLLFSSYISYLNIKINKVKVMKGNFKTYLGLMKNILYWIIPSIIYFTGFGFIVNTISPSGLENTITDNLLRNLLLSIYLSIGGVYLYVIKNNIFPSQEEFNPSNEEKNRIKNKYNKTNRK